VLQTIRGDERLAGVQVVVVSARGGQDEEIVATEITTQAPDGLGAADLVRQIKVSLDLLTAPSRADRASSEGPVG
jgi:hypothetical protein